MPALTSFTTTTSSARRTTEISRPSLRRSQQNTCNLSKRECATKARVVAQKRRIPLATKYNADSNLATTPTSPTRISLPCTLPRPVLGEVDASLLVEAYPDLAGIPAEYLRDRLPLSAPSMCAALTAVQTTASSSVLPKELQILMNDTVAAACPTHMLAVYTDAPVAFGTKRHVSLFPIHDIVLRAHCANLPAFAPSHPSTSASHATVPVVPLRIPSPETFTLLHGYLYTQHSPSFLAALAPPCASDLLQLTTHASKIHGLWRNACALGVVDAPLYDIIEDSWERTLAAMQSCSS
ncbi:hypothetical protein R3P38DRAFT_3284860 [Favolaschia claudopus]|uniref:BTB domain-containing protein n=1 Tax=Favolaschia claudopus TaxID=2862362 RepID=A0AAW0A5G0_9AGAR